MSEIIGYCLICIGILFDFLGCVGLIRMPDHYNRLQTSTKCVTLGTCGVMFGIFAIYGFTDTGVKALLCAVFLMLTSPVSAHAIARAAHISGSKLWEKSVCDHYEKDKKVQSS